MEELEHGEVDNRHTSTNPVTDAPVYNCPLQRVAVERIGVVLFQDLLAIGVRTVPVGPLLEGEVDEVVPQMQESLVPTHIHVNRKPNWNEQAQLETQKAAATEHEDWDLVWIYCWYRRNIDTVLLKKLGPLISALLLLFEEHKDDNAKAAADATTD